MTSKFNLITSYSMFTGGILGIMLLITFLKQIPQNTTLSIIFGMMSLIGIVLVWANDSMDKTTNSLEMSK